MPATSSLLRCATAGSVADGKSRLVGRLLYASKSLMADQANRRTGAFILIDEGTHETVDPGMPAGA